MKHTDVKAGSDFKLIKGAVKGIFEVWAYVGIGNNKPVWGTENFVPFTDERKARRFLMECRKTEDIYRCVYYAPHAS